MSAEHLQALVRGDAFRPTGRFDLLAGDHVPFDELTGQDHHEHRLIETVTGPGGLCLVFGASGSGKSSLISWACHHLPDTYVALRVPVAALEDPGDVKVLAGSVIVSAVRAAADLTAEQEADLLNSTADRRTARPAGALVSGATLGGGPIPGALSLDLGALHQEFEREGLPVDRLHGLDRLVSIFVALQQELVLVLEDTDAMTGGPGEQAERFLQAVLVLTRELDTPMIIAVQHHHRGAAYDRLRQAGREIAIPRLVEAGQALRRIVAHRLHRAELDGMSADQVIDEDAIAALLVGVYDESDGNLRQILAVLQFALDHAVDEQAELLTLPHIRHGLQAARPTA